MSQVVKVLVQRLRPVVADVPTGEGVHLPPTPPGRRAGAASEASGGNPAELELPSYATDGSAGMDLRADEGVTIAPLGRARVPTGLAIALPPGYEGQVRPRSGLAWRHGLTVLNAPGTIDSDYRGEVMVLLVNLGSEPVVLTRGERIAQLVVAPVVRAELELVSAVDGTARGAGGFGHTGKA